MELSLCTLRRGVLYTLLTTLSFGCGGVKPIPYTPAEVSRKDTDDQAVRKAWGRFLSAKGAGSLLKVDSKLGSSCERCATRLELDAERAKLLSDPVKQVVKLIGAMNDPANPHPSYTLWSLEQNRVWLHHEHSVELLGILLGMAKTHPNLNTRRVAAHGAAELAHRLGERKALVEALEDLGEPLPLKFIGPFANQHGRGYHTPYPPEERWSTSHINLMGKGWIEGLTRNKLQYYDLSEGLYEKNRHVSYGAQSLSFSEAKALSLRVNTSAPIKVWWNEQLVFESERVNSELFDVITLPVRAVKGVNRILIKVAEDSKSALRVDLLAEDASQLSEGDYSLSSFEEPLAEEARSTKLTQVTPKELLARILGIQDPISRSFDLEQSEGEEAQVKRAQFEGLYLWAKVAFAAGFEQEEGLALEQLLKGAPRSLVAQLESAQHLRRNGEESAGLLKLEQLSKRAGLQLPKLSLAYAQAALESGNLGRFQGAVNRVRWRFRENMPILSAWLFGLSKRGEYGRMRFAIDYLKRVNPDAPFTLMNEVSYYLGLRQMSKALSSAYRWRALYPGDLMSWRLIAKLEESRDHVEELTSLWQELIEQEPHLRLGYYKLAQAYLDGGKLGELEDLIERWGKVHPTDPTRFAFKATLIDRQMLESNTLGWSDVKPQIAAAWRSAFETFQADYSYLMSLSYFNQEDKVFWDLRFPNDDQIKKLVKALPPPSTKGGEVDVEVIKDLSVFKIYKSGPAVLRRLKILRPTNERGVNKLGKMSYRDSMIEGSSSISVNRSYLLQPNGKKLNPSNRRRGVTRFGQLKVGSVIVYETVHRRASQGYFSEQFSYEWLFQGVRSALSEAEVEVWREEGSPELSVKIRGEVKELSKEELAKVEEQVAQKLKQAHKKRTRIFERGQKRSEAPSRVKAKMKEEFEGELKSEDKSFKLLTEGWERRRWRVKDLTALQSENKSPRVHDLSAMLSVSTLSSWAEVARWERALTFNKLQMNPQLEKKLRELLKGVKGETAQLERILAFVAKEIRYQQDYESTIAGVQPHSAQMVFRRRYGDCKDQAVLFTTLARAAGLKAELAILNVGRKKIKSRNPSHNSFNHMIAYAPAQGDLKRGRFYDPTASKLDVQATPIGDQGADALIIYTEPHLVEGKLREFDWVEVPSSGVNDNRSETSYKLKLDKEGNLTGEGSTQRVGAYSSYLRSAQTPLKRLERFEEFMIFIDDYVEVSEVKAKGYDLTKTMSLTGKVHIPHFAHQSKANELIIPVFKTQPFSGFFGNSRRRLAFTGLTPRSYVYTIDVELPPKAQLKQVPKTIKVDHECFYFDFKPKKTGDGLSMVASYGLRCDELSAKQYHEVRKLLRAAYRDLSRQAFKVKL